MQLKKENAMQDIHIIFDLNLGIAMSGVITAYVLGVLGVVTGPFVVKLLKGLL